MSKGLPCPNPTCTYVFSPAAVSGAAALSCPLCGSVFQFRGSGSAPVGRPVAPPPVAPSGLPVAGPPKSTAEEPWWAQASDAPARSVPVAPPRAMPVAAPPPAAAPAPKWLSKPAAAPAVSPGAPCAPPPASAEPDIGGGTAEIFKPPEGFPTPFRKRRRGWGLGPLVLLLLIAGAVGVAVKMDVLHSDFIQKLLHPEPADEVADGSAGPRFSSQDLNFRFQAPDKAWRRDEPLRTALNARLALKRSEPNTWVALDARDYKKNTPSPDEVFEEAVNRLGGYFEDLTGEQKEDVMLGSQRAQRVSFQGKVKGTALSGECCFFASRGVAYWFIAWTTQEDSQKAAKQVQDEFEALRQGFALRNDRPDWQEKPIGYVYEGKQGPYALHDLRYWKELPNPKDLDARADLLLVARDPREPWDNVKKGSVAVLLLDRPADLKAAVDIARKHVLAQHRKDYKQTTMEVVDDAGGPADRPGPVGNNAGHIVKMRVRNGDLRIRFLLLAVVLPSDFDRVIALQCECDFNNRATWEPIFQQIVSEFKVKAK